MFVFAILYFGIITDAGTARPDHRPHPARRRHAADAHRRGHGAARAARPPRWLGRGHVPRRPIPAMLPLYERLGMDRRVLACVASMAAGVNFLPWTGPMLRASAALHIPARSCSGRSIPVQLVGLAFVFGSPDCSAGARSGGSGWRGRATDGPCRRAARADAERAARCGGRGRFWVNVAADGRDDGGDDRRHASIPALMFMVGTALALLDQLSRRRRAARARRRARDGGADDGRHPARGGSVHRHHEGHRHARRDGACRGRRRAAARGAAHPGRCSASCRCRSACCSIPDSFYLGVLPVVAEVARHARRAAAAASPRRRCSAR